jgi:hypothetical protein
VLTCKRRWSQRATNAAESHHSMNSLHSRQIGYLARSTNTVNGRGLCTLRYSRNLCHSCIDMLDRLLRPPMSCGHELVLCTAPFFQSPFCCDGFDLKHNDHMVWAGLAV